MMQAEFVRRIVHQLHQFRRFPDDGSTVAPGKNSCKKAGDLNVLLFAEPVRNGNGIIQYKRRSIVFLDFPVEEIFEILYVHCEW
jgi:hypothetical protein